MNPENEAISKVSNKTVDYLDEDKKIKGQIYALVSIAHPEFDKRMEFQMYCWNKFQETYLEDLTKMRDLAKGDLEMTEKVLENFIRRSKNARIAFNDYLSENEKSLHERFNKEHDVPYIYSAVKVRGVVENKAQANTLVKKIQKKKDFDIMLVEVGKWFSSELSKNVDTDRKEYYAEDKLNEMMGALKEQKEKIKEYREKEIENSKKSTSKKMMEKIEEVEEEKK